MGDLFCPFDVTETAFRVRTERLGPRFNVSGRQVVERHRAETVSVIQIEHAELGSADACRALQHGFKYRFEVARRGGNDLQNIGRRSLLLERLAQVIGALTQFVEQPRVLDGDDRLVRKTREQVDLFIGERPDLLPKDIDCADQLIVLEHWNGDQGPNACEFDASDRKWIAINICLLCHQVGKVHDLLGPGELAEGGLWSWTDRSAFARLNQRGRRVVGRGELKDLSIVQVHRAELGLADASRILQHGLEYRLEIAWRARDYAQHLGGGRLLLQRFAQVVEETGVLDGDGRLVGKGGDQLDLLVGERPHLGACQPKSPNWNAVPQHWNAEIGAKAPKSLRFRPVIIGVSLHIGNMNNLPFK